MQEQTLRDLALPPDAAQQRASRSKAHLQLAAAGVTRARPIVATAREIPRDASARRRASTSAPVPTRKAKAAVRPQSLQSCARSAGTAPRFPAKFVPTRAQSQ